MISSLKAFLACSLLFMAAGAASAAGYQLRLPLQYDRYLPWSARSLGMGGAEAAGGGALSLFGHPDRTCVPGRWEAAFTASGLSSGSSHVSIQSERTPALPAAAAGSLRLGGHRLSLGWRRAMDDRISFPDVQDPLLEDRAELALDQVSFGWAYSAGGNASLGMALTYARAGFEWQGPERPYARGRAAGYGFSAGLTIPVTSEIKLSVSAAAKSEIEGTADFQPDPEPGDLELSGAIPSRTAAALEYRPETGLVLAAEAAMTGWNGVTLSYEGLLDLHLGVEARIFEGLFLRLGAFTRNSPLDEYERRLDPALQDMYLLAAGLGLSWRGFHLDLGVASSRPLSGGGQSQDMAAATVGFGP